MRAEYRQILKLRYLTAFRKGFASEIDKLLFLPACIGFYLSGVAYAEYSYAVNLQWSRYDRFEWNFDLLSLTGIRPGILPPIVTSGTLVGTFTKGICAGNGLKPANVIAVAEHDTGSAMSLLSAEGDDCVGLSQGTMSVISVPIATPVLSPYALESHIGIEANHGGGFRLARNITGLMLIQKCRAVWNRRGIILTYEEMEHAAQQAAERRHLFQTDDPALRLTENAPSLIDNLCGASLTPGETVRAIYDSLADTYLETIRLMERETGIRYRKIRTLGGGCRSALLCQTIADRTGIPVAAGPAEGSLIGNICVQLIASGEAKNMREAAQAIHSSDSLVYYYPR
jgi:rhamnulokinase/L-fuculokinase